MHNVLLNGVATTESSGSNRRNMMQRPRSNRSTVLLVWCWSSRIPSVIDSAIPRLLGRIMWLRKLQHWGKYELPSTLGATPASCRRVQIRRRCLTGCSRFLKKMATSSGYAKADCHIAEDRITYFALCEVTDPFFNPNVVRENCDKPVVQSKCS